MNLIAITNLFPNKYETHRGMFNVRQFRALSERASVRVVAPIPYYPGMSRLRARAAFGRVRDVEWQEEREGLTVYHPRYLSIPKLGRSLYGFLYYRGIKSTIERITRSFDIDGVFASWVYPDGFGSYLMAKRIGVPLVIKAEGSDINQYMRFRLRRNMIVRALNGATRVIAVSHALADKMSGYGVDRDRITVLHNGADSNVFGTVLREHARESLGISEDVKRILFVGNLVPVKGLRYLIDAMRLLSERKLDVRLHVVGYGPLQNKIVAQAKDLDIRDKIVLEGEKTQDEIALWMNACDVLCLPSVSEGSPTVVAEALSCGLPVVGTTVGGVPEMVTSEMLGILVAPRDARELSGALLEALTKEWDREEIRGRGSRFSWQSNANKILSIFEDCHAGQNR